MNRYFRSWPTLLALLTLTAINTVAVEERESESATESLVDEASLTPHELAVFESLGGKTPEEAMADIHRRFEKAAKSNLESFLDDPILAASDDPERLIEARLVDAFGSVNSLKKSRKILPS